MKFLWAFLFSTVLFSICGYAQDTKKTPSEITSDTIEGTSTDTSIIYIIKKPPVTIKERFEMEVAKKKKYLYLSLAFQSFLYSNKYKSQNGYEEYTSNLNASTSIKYSYGFSIQTYFVPKKIMYGVSVGFRKINERMKYPFINSADVILENSYSYLEFGGLMGKWYSKGESFSYQLIVNPIVIYKIDLSGYTIENNNNPDDNYLTKSSQYDSYNLNLRIIGKILYRTRNSYIELSPYIIFAPFSMTKKTEWYSIRRHVFGMSIGLTNKLF